MGGRRGLQPNGQALLSFDPLIGGTNVRSIRRSETCTELASFRESMMVASISGGAEKLKAMNGVVVKALKPIEEKALRKSLPLIYSKMIRDKKPVLIPQKTNHLWIQPITDPTLGLEGRNSVDPD